MLIGLGLALTEFGAPPEAVQVCRDALATNQAQFGEVHESVATSLHALGEALRRRRDLPAAKLNFRAALSQWRQLERGQGPEAALALNDLGLAFQDSGEFGEAETLFEESYALRSRIYGEDNMVAAESLGNLGLNQWYQGLLPRAKETLRKTLAIRTKMLPESHPDVLGSYNNLALVLRDGGDLDEAKKHHLHVLTMLRKNVPEGDFRITLSSNNLAIVLRRLGVQTADPALLREALRTNPVDPLTADAIATFFLKPSMKPIATEQQGFATPWLYTYTPPEPNWLATDFSSTAWTSAPPPRGSPMLVPRKPNTPIPSHTDLWLRREFVLSNVPLGKVMLRIDRNQDAGVFINGNRVAPTADWSDTPILVPSTAALKSGRNVLAVHCQDADGGQPIDVSIYTVPNPSAGRKRLTEEFTALIAAEKERAELYAGRASARARLGQWQEAANDLAEAVRFAPNKADYRYQLAAAQLGAGNVEGYQATRRDALVQFADAEDPAIAELISRLAFMGPPDKSESPTALKLANRGAAAEFPQGLAPRQLAKGLAEYREGQFASAVEWLQKALTTSAQKNLPGWTHERERNREATAWLVIAMAREKMKEPGKADEAFAKGLDLIRNQFPAVGSDDFGREWTDYMMALTLQREAGALLAERH